MNYKIIEKENINYITLPELEELGLFNLFTLNKLDFKFDPDIEGEELGVITGNLALIKDELNISPEKLFTAKQSHTKNVRVIELDRDFDEMAFGGKYWDVDGMITGERNIMLITRYADCTPIIFYDMDKKVHANIHSGWRGTVQKIALVGLDKMIKNFNSDLKDIKVVIGPAIGWDDFEVTEEVYDLFKNAFPKYGDTIRQKDDTHWLIDTREINKRMLLNAGILEENITSIDISTYSDERFHSYRRDKGQHGVMGFITMLK